jgi:predicted acyl esterase
MSNWPLSVFGHVCRRLHFVFQDIRGRYGSKANLKCYTPPPDPRDPKGVTESTDTYDTIDWLVKNGTTTMAAWA